MDRRAGWWRLGVALLLVAVMLVVVACGGDDEEDTPGATATPGASTMATSVSPEPTASTGAATTATEPSADVPTGLKGDLIVFAAASLTDAFGEIKELLEDANPGLTITYNFAGSQQLATQLAEGARADVFASANSTQMTAAQDADAISGEPVIFVRNRLAIVVPADNPASIQTPADLANDGIKLVVAAEAAPVGAYTLQILDNLSADPEFGANFRSRVEANIVSHEDNVRQVVTKVQLGEADAGVVYVSDVTPDVREDVAIIEIPEEFNVIATYPVATVAGGDAELAQAFMDYLLAPGGQAILVNWGFTSVEP